MPDTRVVIVDDEPLARDVLRNLLVEVEGIAIAGEYGNGRDALAAINTLKPDILFLDAQMPDLDGFGVLRGLTNGYQPIVILVTAYDAFAVQAFEAEALDFLVKPFTDDRFHRALDRARRRLTPQPTRRRLLVSSGRRATSLSVESIMWIAADDYYVRVHIKGASHLLRQSLGSLEHELDPRTFVRIHRSALVNVAYVREVRRESDGRSTLILVDGTRLEISERRRAAVLRVLGY